jgi:hypothetical protein
MARFVGFIVIGVVAVLASGCATPTLTVTYYTDPAGATLYEGNGKRLGPSPYSACYTISPEQQREGVARLSPITARWPSGAETETGVINANLNQCGYSQQLTLFRPKNVPGVEIDVGHAIASEQNEIARRQAAAAEKQADAADRSVGNPALRALYYGAARSAAAEGDMQKANAFRTLGDMQ